MHSLSKTEQITGWICRVTLMIILLAALLLKFKSAEESVYIALDKTVRGEVARIIIN